jgi:hypothetical protein
MLWSSFFLFVDRCVLLQNKNDYVKHSSGKGRKHACRQWLFYLEIEQFVFNFALE